MDLHDARAVLAALVSSTGHPEAIEALPVVLAELDDARARLAELSDTIDAAHGIICNAHQKRVDDVTTEDGASPGWAEVARGSESTGEKQWRDMPEAERKAYWR